MESEDYSFYKGLVYLTENNISDLGYELTFSAEVIIKYNDLLFIFSRYQHRNLQFQFLQPIETC